MNIEPIGVFHSNKKNPYEAARQPSADASDSSGIITLDKGKNLNQALIGLEGFSHIWVIFQFHHNENWKPMVLPPRGTEHKVGVFATRAPYRPNPIGISAVRLEKIDGLDLYIGNHDLLDQTPIFDIKPYLAYSDSIPDATSGWLKLTSYQINFQSKALEKIQFLNELGVTELAGFLKQQLSFEPTDERRKRVRALNNGKFEIAYRTWRASFIMTDDKIVIEDIYSGYTPQDLANSRDLYSDKNSHRLFLNRYT